MSAPEERVLLPLGEPEDSETIREFLRSALTSEGTQLDLLHVLPAPGARRDHAGSSRQARLDAHRCLSDMGEALRPATRAVRIHLRSGDPAAAILDFAEETRPTLIAMLKHGSAGHRNWLLGSVAERVLRRCRQPLLLLAPRAARPIDARKAPPIRKILIPVDGSERSTRVGFRAGTLASRCDARLILLHSRFEERAGGRRRLSDEARADRKAAPAEAERLRGDLADLGLDVEIRVGHRRPAVEILSVLDAEEVDLLAVTTHGHGAAASSWPLGPVAEKVLRNCPASLLVLPVGPARAPGATSNTSK